jgi:membrane protease YdiL (CAAX protease family)
MTPTPGDDGGATADESEPPPQSAREYDTCARSDRDLWIETSVVILYFVVTALYGAVAMLIWPEEYRDRYSLNHSLSFLVTDAANIGLVIYLIWRSAESWSGFGLVRPRWLMDTLLGLAFWGTAWAIHAASWRVVDGLFGPDLFETANHDDAWFVPTPNGIVAVVAFVFSVCVSAFAEELVMRAYLVPRFERLLGSSTRSIFVTAGLFASFHIYQGIDGAVSAFIMGLVYGTMFLWSRRLWPVAVAHSISNLLVFWSSFAERV